VPKFNLKITEHIKPPPSTNYFELYVINEWYTKFKFTRDGLWRCSPQLFNIKQIIDRCSLQFNGSLTDILCKKIVEELIGEELRHKKIVEELIGEELRHKKLKV
jgi:hypothetical protein